MAFCFPTGPLSALYKDVSVVHPSLLDCLEPLENQQVRELLKRLGVHELEPQDLLEQHIYPTIRSDKWKVTLHQKILQIRDHQIFLFSPVPFSLNVSFFSCFSSVAILLIPTQVKVWVGARELPGFHQATLFWPGVLRLLSTRPHLQGSALPGQRKGAFFWRVRQHQPEGETSW